MKTQNTPNNDSTSLWTKAPVSNLVRYEPSGIYFARAKVHGKLIRKSLDTNVLSIAKLRLADVLETEHKAIGSTTNKIIGKMTFGDALALFREQQKISTEIKERSKEYNQRCGRDLLKTWKGLENLDIKRITKQDCLRWRAEFGNRYSATVTNGTLSVLRRIFDIAVETGARYDNPARMKEVKRARVRRKELRLPEPDQFSALVKEVRESGSGFSPHCADAIEFFAYAGPRLKEASRIFGRDCSFSKNEIVIRGDAKTGTKNWEIRRVPMIPEMRQLLERLKKERGEQEFLNNPVPKVQKFNRSLKRACKKLELFHLTHHDLRHLFATRCIESGVDIPTVAKWLGHKDGGVLAMQTYGHLRDKHSADMALKVIFHTEPAAVPVASAAAAATPTKPANDSKPQDQKLIAATIAQKVTFSNPPENVIAMSKEPGASQSPEADERRVIAKAKAKYAYAWWVSANPQEIFWGQLHEDVWIVPTGKFLEAATQAMGREVFSQELNDRQSLKEEFSERISVGIIKTLSANIQQKTPASPDVILKRKSG